MKYETPIWSLIDGEWVECDGETRKSPPGAPSVHEFFDQELATWRWAWSVTWYGRGLFSMISGHENSRESAQRAVESRAIRAATQPSTNGRS